MRAVRSETPHIVLALVDESWVLVQEERGFNHSAAR